MVEYHVDCEIDGIYAGVFKKRGNKEFDKWLNKTNVTQEAICAVIDYIMNNGCELKIPYKNTKYTIKAYEDNWEEEPEHSCKTCKWEKYSWCDDPCYQCADTPNYQMWEVKQECRK